MFLNPSALELLARARISDQLRPAHVRPLPPVHRRRPALSWIGRRLTWRRSPAGHNGWDSIGRGAGPHATAP